MAVLFSAARSVRRVAARAATAQAITRKDLERQALLELLKKAGYEIGKATYTVAAVFAGPVLCSELKVGPWSAILRITGAAFDRNDKPILVTVAHYRSDRYQLRLDLQHCATCDFKTAPAASRGGCGHPA